MENGLLIPDSLDVLVGKKTAGLILLTLKLEVAILLLGSLVYELKNKNGERKFSPFIKEIPRFSEYLAFFLENKMLEKGTTQDSYKCPTKVYKRGLYPYYFDSVIVSEIIGKYYPNLFSYTFNLFKFHHNYREVV